jgi:hypothetical protein
MTDEKQIKRIFQVLNLEPNEEFSIVSPGYGHLIIVKNAYITETLHLFDRADGKMKDDYILNLLRGILKVKKAA